jgi:hypothetical protein
LWDRKLTLLNGTRIPYRQLKIPCCKVCNNEYLGRIERQVQAACDAGRDAVLALPRLTLFLWAGKILYGLLYREHLLPVNRRVPTDGPIVSAELLEQLRMHHQFLQAARVRFDFTPHIPASIFVYETSVPSNAGMGFDYWDELQRLAISIRVGNVGIVVCLQDGQAVERVFGSQHKKYTKLALHWTQFAEVTARIFYDLLRFNRTPKFMLIEGGAKVQVLLSPIGGLSSKPLFDEGNIHDYARVLAHCSRFPLELIHPEPGKVISWLFRRGRLRRMHPDDPA